MARFTTSYVALLAALAAVVGTWAVPAASAAPVGTSVRAPVLGRAAAHSPRRRAIITFDKLPADPTRSRVTWKVVRRSRDGVRHVVEKRSWRAGSGMLGKAGHDECAKGQGWLPNGRYRLRFYRDYPGSLIKGRAFRLDDHTCRNGHTRRVALFIHTEQGAGNTQCPDRPGDQPCRWEVPKIDDYKSAGCIKMAPEDLAALSRHFLRYFRAGVRYPMSRVVVRVVA